MSERSSLIEHLLQSAKDHTSYLDYNAELLNIYEGNIVEHVKKILKDSLSDNYYKKIEDRIVPINVLTRVIDKMSKVYTKNPMRSSESSQEWIDEIEKTTAINTIMGVADSYSHLFKGYLLQPYHHNKEIKLRPVAFDRFIPIAGNKQAPEHMSELLLYMGEIKDSSGAKDSLYYYYTEEKFLAFTGRGHIYAPAMEGNDGINTYGFIPFTYGNRSITRVLPNQDTDIAQMSKMIPVVLSDLAGAIMFQCFSIMYGIDVDADNITMSPNAFWSLKSDKTSDKTPSVGTLKPQVDISETREYILDVFSLWLETKGVRVGSIGSANGANVANGISKIIDEMDVFEVKKESIEFFKREENDLWQKIAKLNNIWSKQGHIDTEIIPEDFDFSIEFDEPKPEMTRSQQIADLKAEMDAGLTDRETAIKRAHPDLDEEGIQKMLANAKKKESTNPFINSQGNVNDGVDTQED